MTENYISEMKDELFVTYFFIIFNANKNGGILLKWYSYALW